MSSSSAPACRASAWRIICSGAPPWAAYTILESRDAIGGTWDLFRYPGIRSDSDMHTLGYNFRPWRDGLAIAEGGKIRAYIEDTAREAGIDRHIRFGTRAERADWSSATGRWTVTTPAGALTCRFLVMCSGYYSYSQGHRPRWEGEAEFAAPSSTRNSGRGSRLARQARRGDRQRRHRGHVVPLWPARRRTSRWCSAPPPTSPPALPTTALPARLKRVLSLRAAAGLTRWKNVLIQQFFFRMARRRPDKVKAKLVELVERRSAPSRRATSPPATIPGTSASALHGRRPVRSDARRHRLGHDRRDRALHADGAGVGQRQPGARGHRRRPPPA
jgi:cation diffusion facilitator CzcD-associated flavoprotein CzcO